MRESCMTQFTASPLHIIRLFVMKLASNLLQRSKIQRFMDHDETVKQAPKLKIIRVITISDKTDIEKSRKKFFNQCVDRRPSQIYESKSMNKSQNGIGTKVLRVTT